MPPGTGVLRVPYSTISNLATSPVYQRRIDARHLEDDFRLAGHALVHQLPMLCSSQRLGTADRVVRRTPTKSERENRGAKNDIVVDQLE